MSMLKGFRIVSRNLKGESGRSMIEMLATLVIVGILSISALWGYRYAIEVHKENETVDWVVKSIVGARTGFITDKYGEQAEEDGSVRVPIKEVISGVTYLEPETDGVVYGFTTPTQAEISVDVIDQKTFEVYVDEMTWNVCRKLLGANLEYTSAKLVKEETPHFVYTTSSSDEINDFCEIVDPAKRRPSQPVSNDPNVEQGVSFVLCFGDDCQGGCPPNKRLCPADLQCCSACTEDGKCANNEKGCPVDTPYECADGCCDERCPYRLLGANHTYVPESYCSCPDKTKACAGVCIPEDKECCPTGSRFFCEEGLQCCQQTIDVKHKYFCAETCDQPTPDPDPDPDPTPDPDPIPDLNPTPDCNTEMCGSICLRPGQACCGGQVCVGECSSNGECCPNGACGDTCLGEGQMCCDGKPSSEPCNDECEEGAPILAVRKEIGGQCMYNSGGCAPAWTKVVAGPMDVCILASGACDCLEYITVLGVCEGKGGYYPPPCDLAD